MLLLAVSGGPDSMFLLNEYKKKDIVVAHVNYGTRKDSDKEEEIVRDFCHKYKIPVEVLKVDKESNGNFESWAREVRYKFFKKIYDKYGATKLLTGHHKDDFIETALMQQESGRVPKYFGIRKKTSHHGMNIVRPFVHLYWKREIERELDKESIPFGIDKSNFDDKYTRNKIRKQLSRDSFSEKKNKYQWFRMSNRILKKKFARIEKMYSKWLAKDFELKFFRGLPKDKVEIIYELINDKFDNVKLSKGKIDSLVDFLNGLEGNKSFKLNARQSITKKNGKVVFNG